VSVALRAPATVASALADAAQRLDASEARLLLAHALGASRAQLVAHPERTLAGAVPDRFAALVARRAAGEPIAYLVGEREFWSLALHVTPAVLIPRPETEALIERALERLPRSEACSVLELGTGSGAIAIALARERPQARIVATDISEEALAVARDNAARHGVDIAFVRGDWLDAVGAGRRFDLVVSNPPYVCTRDPHLGRGDLRFEPRVALDGGDDGLDCIRRIVREAREHLSPGGWLALEHGHDQAPACREILVAAGYGAVESCVDLAGLPRVCVGRRAH